MDADIELEHSILETGIPPRPEILIRLDEEAKKESPDFKKIERLIGADMGISAALIKTINSPFYGLRTKVSSVRQAIGMLGLSSVTRVVTGMVLRNIVSGTHLVETERLLEDASELALVCSYIAKKIRGVNSDHAFTFGLFQNCGILLLLTRLPNYQKTLETANESLNKILPQVEFEHHGVTHAYVGSLMAGEWGLQESITQAICFHHDYNEITDRHKKLSNESRNLSESQDLIALGLLAERAIKYHTGFDRTAEWVAGGKIALEHFGFTEEDFQGIVEDVLDVLSESH